MPSTYTNLGIQKMATGEKAGTWGTLTNTNWDIIEQIAGAYTTQAITDATTTALTKNDGTTGATLATRAWKLTGTLSSGNAGLTVPDAAVGWWIVNNAVTMSTYTVSIGTVSNTAGVVWLAGDNSTKIIYNDGTNCIDVGSAFSLTSPALGTAINDVKGNELIKVTATASAVNEFTIANAASGSGPILSTTGGGTNIDLNLNPKGSGTLKSGTAAVKVAGTETIWVPATAMYAETTNGAELAQTVLTAGNPELKAFAFDTTTAEAVQFNVSFPKSWNAGTVTFQTMWSASGTNTGTGGFTLAGCSVASDVDYDLAFGTPVANTSLAASGTQDDLMINVVSGAVTIASVADATNTIFRLVRNVSGDDNTGDLRLVGIKIFYTTDAANDA
jgi:hypothetical protein